MDMTAVEQKGPALSPGGWLEGAWVVLDPGGLILEANGPMRSWLGLPAPVQPGTRFWELIERHCPAWKADLVALRACPDTFAEARLSLGGELGQSSRWYHLERARYAEACFIRVSSILPPRSELGESAWDAYLGDEASRREMFVRLLRAEARLEKLMEYWPGVIFSQRADGSFEYVSPQIEQLTGVPTAQWLRQSHWFWQVVHEGDSGELQQQMQQAAKTGRPVTSTFRIRHLQSGRVSYMLEHRQPVMSHGGLLFGYEGVWLDITRQTIAEKRLSSAAWKETLAVLTMGLAHDFGNIMAGIHSLSESFL
jgi:PAS domain S-box-containing protein